MQITGKHVLITGAGKRLGRAMAERLLPYGIRLTAHYHHSKDAAQELVTLAKQHKSEAQILSADLAKVSELQKLAASAIAKFGPVEILINSASIFYPTAVDQVTESQWDEMMQINLKGQFFLAQAVAKALQAKNQAGVILNIVDINAQRPMANYTPYVCSKAGLAMLTKNLAREWAPLIRVNAISPGPVLLPENYTPEQRARSEAKTLLKRLGTPKDIADAAVFLLENDYITGQDLAVDGGRGLADALSS